MHYESQKLLKSIEMSEKYIFHGTLNDKVEGKKVENLFYDAYKKKLIILYKLWKYFLNLHIYAPKKNSKYNFRKNDKCDSKTL